MTDLYAPPSSGGDERAVAPPDREPLDGSGPTTAQVPAVPTRPPTAPPVLIGGPPPGAATLEA
ncbi:MAG TPA: hypothetical protein VHB02_08400, partial [Acidimicrobiales bacterium]|nr:hypothetical protein [Acidimicrobiales bacterium]